MCTVIQYFFINLIMVLVLYNVTKYLIRSKQMQFTPKPVRHCLGDLRNIDNLCTQALKLLVLVAVPGGARGVLGGLIIIKML